MGLNRLEGKVAIVTGGGNGVGAATTRLFAEEGAHVVSVDIRSDDLAQWNDVANVTPLVADITTLEGIEALTNAALDGFGKIDCLCNVAGINDLSFPLEEVDDERWDRIMDLDLKAPFRLCRRIVPLMVENGGGSIVNIGSYAALRGNHGPSYTAAKAGLQGLTKSIAFAYAKEKVRCNIVHPGGMMTNIGEHSGGSYHAAQAKLSGLCRAMPVNGYFAADEVAKTLVWLCGDESEFVTGAVISVDGGMATC